MNDETYAKMSELLEQLSSRRISRKEFDRRKEELLLNDRRRSAAEGGQPPEETRRTDRGGAGGPDERIESGGAGKRPGQTGPSPTKHRYIAMVIIVLITLAGMRILTSRTDGEGAPSSVSSAVNGTAEDGITEEMLRAGYTAEQTELIRERLNLVGIAAVKVDRMSAAPGAEVNTVLCSPNGLEGEENQIFFTTLNGEIYYIAYQDTYLYDASGIGFISTYEKAKNSSYQE